ncbi:hypothetical protein [Shimia sp.]|uniref:hypothetical protein n=1 Tax=Shimia sp. TaxID=1954381 RepID=UPI003296F4D7
MSDAERRVQHAVALNMRVSLPARSDAEAEVMRAAIANRDAQRRVRVYIAPERFAYKEKT